MKDLQKQAINQIWPMGDGLSVPSLDPWSRFFKSPGRQIFHEIWKLHEIPIRKCNFYWNTDTFICLLSVTAFACRAVLSSYEGTWPIKPKMFITWPFNIFGKCAGNKCLPTSGVELPIERWLCFCNQILYNPRKTLDVHCFGAMPRIPHAYQPPWKKIMPQKILEFSVSFWNRVRRTTFTG